MRALVIGFGSIGMRHARVLRELGYKVCVVSSREVDWDCSYHSLSEALQIEKPQYVIVANKTAEHYQTLLELEDQGYRGKVLVEKPLFHLEANVPPHNFENIFVGYNLRFHPAIQKLKMLMQGQKILSLHVYTGQYLPQWRPHADYRKTYSAKKSEGGGVLRDLSHELDYVNWLLDGWESLTAVGGKFSPLEIDSDDIYSIMLKTKKCPVATININYIEKSPKRFIIVNTDQDTIKVDMIGNTLTVNERTEPFEVSRDYTYKMQHEAVLTGNVGDVCHSEEAMDVMNMINAIEEANEKRSWVSK
ncbi:oxidoreductase [Brevibacillus brevis]|uniref:Gfo/Idh/MocA family protein n=1 Tax=Brevibacillus brevis TaxID=1393 RepID=UPI0019020DB3|nr:Gfo/Idh/MocA family oxidoreductase [Brevibacillus brevis]MBH0328294.1 oxidoreductase [Brevibacillus brevis]